MFLDSRRDYIGWFIFVCAMVLFCFAIHRESIWYDEWYTVEVINRASIKSFFNQIVLTENNPPVYYILLRLWADVAGCFNLVYLRLFSAVMASVGAVMIYKLVNLFNPRRTALVAVMLYLTSPYILWYAQEARNMAFACVISMAIVIFFYRFSVTGSKKDLVLAAIFQLVGLYTHSFLLAFIVAQVIYLFIKGDRKLIKMWSVAVLAILALYLFWVPFLFKQIMINKSGWLKPLSLFFPINMMVHFSVGIFQFSHAGLVLLSTFVYTSLLVVSIFSLTDRKKSLTGGNLFLTLVFFTPIVLSVLISVLIKPILFEGRRYLVVVVPIFLVMVSIGLCSIKNRRFFVSVLLLVLMMNIFCMRNLYKNGQKRYWNKASDYLSELSSDGDGVFSVDHTRGAILVYAGGIGKAKMVDMGDIFIERKLYPYNRVWFITTGDPRQDETKRLMYSSFSLIGSKIFTNSVGGRIEIFLYDLIKARG